MIVPDANLLLYAYDTSSRFHLRSAAWWQTCLSGDERVGLCGPVLFAFLRVGTSRWAFEHPLTIGEAAGGDLTTDAQIAAIAERHRATVHTADTDFSRFPGVRWHNPIL